jgi:hypothetical protein
MKPLFKYYKNGYDFTVIERHGDIALAHGMSRISTSENWEIFEVQSHQGRDINGSHVEPAEFVPSDRQWGIKGWTALNKRQAYQIFQSKVLIYPDYGIRVKAVTQNGESGIWQHGQYGWYPDGKWGVDEYPHDHIVTWKPL